MFAKRAVSICVSVLVVSVVVLGLGYTPAAENRMEEASAQEGESIIRETSTGPIRGTSTEPIHKTQTGSFHLGPWSQKTVTLHTGLLQNYFYIISVGLKIVGGDEQQHVHWRVGSTSDVVSQNVYNWWDHEEVWQTLQWICKFAGDSVVLIVYNQDNNGQDFEYTDHSVIYSDYFPRQDEHDYGERPEYVNGGSLEALWYSEPLQANTLYFFDARIQLVGSFQHRANFFLVCYKSSSDIGEPPNIAYEMRHVLYWEHLGYVHVQIVVPTLSSNAICALWLENIDGGETFLYWVKRYSGGLVFRDTVCYTGLHRVYLSAHETMKFPVCNFYAFGLAYTLTGRIILDGGDSSQHVNWFVGVGDAAYPGQGLGPKSGSMAKEFGNLGYSLHTTGYIEFGWVDGWIYINNDDNSGQYFYYQMYAYRW